MTAEIIYIDGPMGIIMGKFSLEIVINNGSMYLGIWKHEMNNSMVLVVFI